MTAKNPPRKRSLEILLLALALVLSFAGLELGLRIFTVFPVGFESNRVDHPSLGYTLNPRLDDADESGFRNAECTLEESPIVTIGDSHTFGNNVLAEDSFPSQLSRATGRCVYNFGIGSYGIFQYGALLSELTRSRAESIVLAFYPTNDLYTNPVVCELIRAPYWQAYAVRKGLELPDCSEIGAPRPDSGSFVERTATYQALENVLDGELFANFDGSSLINPVTHFVFDADQSVDKSRVRRHLRTTSLERANVRTNFELSKSILTDAYADLKAASIDLAVLVIPSKERVIYEWAVARGVERDPEFDEIVASEIRLTDAYTAFFADAGIPHGLALPNVSDAFADTVANGDRFYRPNDGHPYAAGYAAYAQAAFSLLARTASSSTP